MANFVSMLAGWAALSWLEGRVADRVTIDNALPYLWTMMGAAYVATVFLEWPLLLVLFWKRRRNVWVALRASVAAQTASYAVLVPFYCAASTASVLTHMTVTRPAAMAVEPSTVVYFIAAGDGRACRLRLDGSAPEPVSPVPITDPDARLFVCRNDGGAAWDLWAKDRPGRNGASRLLAGLPGAAGVPPWVAEGRDEEGTWFTFGPAVDLRRPDERGAAVEAGFWPFEGLRITRGPHESERLAVECPFLRWPSRNATVLPGDQVVYQLGGQIVLLDLRTRRIALLARGRGPVVFLGRQVTTGVAAASTPATAPASRPAPQD